MEFLSAEANYTLRFINQTNKSIFLTGKAGTGKTTLLKEIIATKIKSQSRDHWVEIFSDTDGCVTPVLNMQEAQEHEHNISRESFVNLEGFNQPAPAPRFSNDILSIKYNAKEVGSDIDDICDEFNLDKEAFS